MINNAGVYLRFESGINVDRNFKERVCLKTRRKLRSVSTILN